MSTALYVDDDGKVSLHEFPISKPLEGEMLIQVLYSGINPADTKTIKFFGWRRRVLGNEFCGRIIEGPGLADSPFEAGDIVAGSVKGTVRPNSYGTHQTYISIPPTAIFKVPDNLPPPDASCLSVTVLTASDALFNILGLPLPGTAKPSDGSLVIWGASTSVGLASIQLARVIGIKSVIVTASASRHAYLKTLGATQCFDYKNENVIDQVKAAIKTETVWGFDAVGSQDSQNLLAKAVSGALATVDLNTSEGFRAAQGARHYDLVFDLPNGSLVLPASPAAAEKMWKALTWVVGHYGAEYQAPPVEVVGADAIEMMHQVGDMSRFGKVVLKHPLRPS